MTMSQPNPSRRDALRLAASAAVLVAAPVPRVLAQSPGKGPFVLVHPAWHGAWYWKKLTPLLRAKDYDVYTPTLTGLGERAHLARPEVGLRTHIQDVVSVLEYGDLRNAILVGNSSGGMVITGVAERVPERVAQVIYLDAFVPGDGQSLLDLLAPERRRVFEEFARSEGNGWLVPRFAPLPWEHIVRSMWGVKEEADVQWMLARLVPTPLGHFTEPVRRANPASDKLARTYVRCLHFKNPAFDQHAAMARHASNWRYREMATPHLPPITHPLELSELLAELA
jgi:pimeloyl-ACP methyl ester carboxylesterase